MNGKSSRSQSHVRSDARATAGATRLRRSVLRSVVSSRSRSRRPRVEYSEQEVRNLLRGVQKYGRDFKAIRLVYEFHPSRTPVDLYDKFRHMRPRLPPADGADPEPGSAWRRLAPGGDAPLADVD
ncbi:telomere repeats-binding bouquet formation protein 1-like [Pollicipes pollicipes]|uniref:telomere repeats-binding bouquet formation protein 1-like n=1 Tax=Pollicipes pollicipes TaxID=41117 RepID=UPI00188564FB|nr:telomere repeats-binding bouquet formation protein 1-like [Pollicipes pollicipes]